MMMIVYRPVKHAEDDASMTSSRWRASRDYELSPDLREKQVEMLCRKYGGASVASHAARVIQHAYRRYRLNRSFARMRLQASGTTLAVVRGPAVVDPALAESRVVGGVRCRVRARDVAVTDAYGNADTVRWTGTDCRRVVAVHKSHSVSVTSTRHHHRVVVRTGCCVSPDTSSDGRGPRGIVVHRRYGPPPTAINCTVPLPPSFVDGSRSDDELAVVPRTTSNFDDVDELTDADDVVQLRGDDDATFQQLCLTESSYGEMTTTTTEVDSDTDDVGPGYVDVETLEDAAVNPRSHIYSSLRLCGSSKHSTTMALADQSATECDSPVWKRKDVIGSADDSKDAKIRCVGCGWRGQSAPQLSDVPPPMTTSGSVSTGSLATIGR